MQPHDHPNHIPLSSLSINPDRQRKDFLPEAVVELSDSIAANGLLHPIVVRPGEIPNHYLLVAGERRLKAIEYLRGMGQPVRVGSIVIPDGFIPVTHLASMDPLDAMEAELDENIKRVDLTWQEKSEATARLYHLRSLQATKWGTAPPTVSSIHAEVGTAGDSQPEATRTNLLLASHLKDPTIANARSAPEALKLLKRKEENERSAELGKKVGGYFSYQSHNLLFGNCFPHLAQMASETFDVILTDPPYGMDAGDFNDSGGKTSGGHFYDDSYKTWLPLVKQLATESFRLAKPNAHLYCFCDIDNFHKLRELIAKEGWRTFRTPFIWFNPTSNRAPWPFQGPHRKWQSILYAVKGDRPVIHLTGDVLTYKSDPNVNHPAQKPVDLFADLLRRSCRPGDSVLDPFCGSGPIFPAAHGLKIKATGIEMDEAAYGMAVARLERLKK